MTSRVRKVFSSTCHTSAQAPGHTKEQLEIWSGPTIAGPEHAHRGYNRTSTATYSHPTDSHVSLTSALKGLWQPLPPDDQSGPGVRSSGRGTGRAWRKWRASLAALVQSFSPTRSAARRKQEISVSLHAAIKQPNNPKEQVMNHRFVGGSAGYVHLTVRDSRHLGGSAGWVAAW